MILWPVGVALGLVWLVFRDPAFDYRMLVVGALVPDLVDGPFGGARWAHTLLGAVIVLAAVMLATRGHRHVRRSLLAVPIGMFAHLVSDGMWARTETFWWPFFGRALGDPLPALDHGWTVLALEELAGAAIVLWCWHRFRLSDDEVRRRFLRTGHLPRDISAD